jgi:hypothetical protein
MKNAAALFIALGGPAARLALDQLEAAALPKRTFAARCSLILLLIPALAHADARYTMASRTASGLSAPIVVEYLVAKEVVRVGASEAQRYQLFKDGTIYFVDTASRSVQTVPDATLNRIRQLMAEQVKKMEDTASKAPPDGREMAERAATMMKEVNQARWKDVPRDFRETSRSETAAVGPCRVWEEFEQGIKRLELCVAPTGAVPGGADILRGMRILSEYLHGSAVAFGVDFGSADVWPRIEALGGLPVIIREFKDGAAVSEMTMTAAREVFKGAKLLEVPSDYLRKEGPKLAPQ